MSSRHAALRRGRVSLPGQLYLLTTTTVERQALFADFHLACTAARAFNDPRLLDDARLLAWVLMPDHVHWLVSLGECFSLEELVLRLKSASARRVNAIRNTKGAVWAPAYHDHALRAEEDVQAVARYIVANPLRAGLVKRAGDYSFWDAVWL
ncbi:MULTISPECIES: REP-associated tyrosine transposase [Pseudomonas]|uniref:Transposase n=1 Tax=Pseudomonas oryzihabitans TaxID=47885 RepID=A0A1G5PDY5_9PSED|nr:MULTISPECIES: transposase [Pseudomonas]MBH3329552.1 transposase [Pseudomonas oryzihabitans]MDK4197905.1 transposase [Pseudomonas sp. HR1]NMY91597.1 transposase [Pseudomonas psychrotolerans]NMZ65431.1 transposase [Pseudomonas oryzihabitans]ONN71868.1 transposase [Pseudomonas psychrotolerans]